MTTTYELVPFKNFEVIFKAIFTNQHSYYSIALKALLIMESIYPRRCLISSRVIVLRFTKTRCHSTVWLKLNYNEVIPFLSYYIKRPIKQYSALHSSLKQAKYFIFPGNIRKLSIPSWERYVSLSFITTGKHLYQLLFYKAAFFD
jgi:hypothetical protein